MYNRAKALPIKFLSTLSLRRATVNVQLHCLFLRISIHALLAESDPLSSAMSCFAFLFLSTLSLRRATWSTPPCKRFPYNFYPRSPCGERQTAAAKSADDAKFLSTLSLRRATRGPQAPPIIYPFLSTLSLRRATAQQRQGYLPVGYFYPRSPCGERLTRHCCRCFAMPFLSTLSLRRATLCPGAACSNKLISIHALLAESDPLHRAAAAAGE